MVINCQSVSFQEVLRAWGVSEFSNPERWSDLKVSEGIRKDIIEGRFESLSSIQWSEIEKEISRFRGRLLEGLKPLNPACFLCELEGCEVGKIRLIRYQPFVENVPSGRLEDLARAAEVGFADPSGFCDNVRRLSRNFDLSEMAGFPIVVAQSVVGPYTLVDGYSRLTSLLCSRLDFRTSLIPLYLGITPSISEWPWYWEL